ncbi:PREDICTED: CUB and peptidase domain-containing protein 2-like [Priapulus caudatus]|uniref:CUB and peptidase domain-containing protein 2-like n=1 Tax=Priapulus caudatus TaxID=37621 RepID=A0ABM1F255_PRICU|nr:PREDICTED: CUB and peptidase domain-containing protein 2-like [Priapulus caudatus]
MFRSVDRRRTASGAWIALIVLVQLLRPAKLQKFHSDTIHAVIRGSPVIQEATWPWQALVLNEGNAHCGGSLINPCHVLTAKHCVEGRDPTKMAVVMGEHQRSVVEGREQTRNVLRFIPHPSWDLAILQLSASFNLPDRVRAVKIKLRLSDTGSELKIETDSKNRRNYMSAFTPRVDQ